MNVVDANQVDLIMSGTATILWKRRVTCLHPPQAGVGMSSRNGNMLTRDFVV